MDTPGHPNGAIRVLLVDDRPVARRLLEAELQQPDIAVCGTARDGREAVERVRDLSPDVVIMDLVMPHMDGLHATHTIRSFSDVPIIILTGSHHDVDTLRHLAKARGADAFLLKPSGSVSADLYRIRDELLETVRRLGLRTRH